MSDAKDINVEFVQPAYAKYREELYRKLSDAYDVRFHFLSDISPGKANEIPEWLDYVEYGNNSHLGTAATLLSTIRAADPDVVITSISDSQHTVLLRIASTLSVLDTSIVLWSEEWRPRVSTSPSVVGIRGFFLKRPFVSKFVLRHVDSLLLPHQKWFDHWRQLGAKRSDTFYVSQCSNDYSTQDIFPVEPDLADKTVFLYLGNIIERKGLDLLIRGFSALFQNRDDAFLLVVGDGPFREECESIADERSLTNVRFTGRVPEAELASYYAYADAFVLPSCLRGHYEPCPISVNEAMSMGLPVVITDAVGSAGWLVRDEENGYVVPESDVDALATALAKLADDPERRSRFSERSRELFETFNDFDRMFKGFSNGIERATR